MKQLMVLYPQPAFSTVKTNREIPACLSGVSDTDDTNAFLRTNSRIKSFILFKYRRSFGRVFNAVFTGNSYF